MVPGNPSIPVVVSSAIIVETPPQIEGMLRASFRDSRGRLYELDEATEEYNYVEEASTTESEYYDG